MLSKQEQIIVYILTVIVIAVGGVLIFVKTPYDNIAVNKAARDAAQVQLEQLKLEYGPAAEKDLDEKIKAAYEDGDKVSEVFYDEMTEYTLDRTLRKFLEDVKDPFGGYKDSANINTDNMEIIGISTETLNLSLPEDKSPQYEIKEKSKIDTSIFGSGNNTQTEVKEGDPEVVLAEMLAKERDDAIQYYEDNKEKFSPGIQEAMRQVLAGNSETVAVHSVSFKMPLSPLEVDAITMAMLKSDKAIYIKGIEIEDLEEDAEDDSEIVVPQIGEGDDAVKLEVLQDKYMYKITFAFYCVQRMDKPNF